MEEDTDESAPIASQVIEAAGKGAAAVAHVLDDHGRNFNDKLAGDLDPWLTVPSSTVFRRCAVMAMQWAGWTSPNSPPDWRESALEFLASLSRFRSPYVAGYQGGQHVRPYLTTWHHVLNDTGAEPGAKTSPADVLRFAHSAFVALQDLESRKERSGLGAWTFYGTFKIYLLLRDDLWNDPHIDAIRLPMGGKAHGYSFEGGWERLHELGVVTALAPGGAFASDLVRYDQAHAEVLKLAGQAETRALHINSGIYLLGGSDAHI